jgi:vacuolar-type H+-ATPase subunit H
MEKVWEELKKIEAQAEQIRNEAQNKAKEISTLADQEAEKLIANGKTYAEEEAKQIFDNAIKEANSKREEQLKENKAVADKLEEQATKQMDQAVESVVNVVLEENKP